MLLKTNIREAWRSLLASKQRTLLALIGVVIGIGSVMAMLSIGETIKSRAMEEFLKTGVDVISVSPGIGDNDGGFTPRDMDRLAGYSRYVLAVSPEIELGGRVQAGPAVTSGSVSGLRPVFMSINNLAMAEGRFLTRFDQGQNFVVLGHEVHKRLLAQGARAPIREVTIQERPFTVIGRLAPANLGFRSGEVDRGLFIPLETAALLTGNNVISRALVKLKPGADQQAAGAELNRLARKLKGPEARLEVSSPRQILQMMQSQMRLFTLLLAAVASISLVVGGVGIMNMMLAAVAERRREIGIRRAMGARRGDITSQFLVESMYLSFTGGLLGIGFGVAAGKAVAVYNNWRLVIPLDAIFLCLAVAVGVGLFFGYYPARKAARLNVIMALKSE